jgi:leucyl-tRNA synthetase
MEFDKKKVESKWKKYWAANNTYKVENGGDKPKYYVLDMFPYPSGSGLHVGHPLGYIASDIYARYKRQRGFNVLHPMGFDAFGLPAEQYAIQTGVHPTLSTEKNIARYREQLDKIGLCFDWSRQVTTSEPSYYKWTQWIFLQLFDHYFDKKIGKAAAIENLIAHFEQQGTVGIDAACEEDMHFGADKWLSFSAKEKENILMNYRLAYRKVGYVNWCEALGTVLANDEVKDGKSERGGHPVTKKPMLQWSLRITAYAERLLKDMESLEWSESLKAMQRNWIGRSEGAQMFFDIQNHDQKLEVFTTRPDTIFGVTFMVLAPEHDIVASLTTADQKNDIDAYIQYVKSRSDIDRMAEVKVVTGAFTGAYAIHPFSNEAIPIWISEYVLKDYGTGAIMAVPSDDERDQAFAQKFSLEIIEVVDKSNYPNATLQDKEGIIINSDFLNGMEVPAAIQRMFDKIEAMGIGKKKINYKLRDANFSRQRYWGEPFPVKYDKDGLTHKIERLPVELPMMDDIKPQSGQSPLARNKVWVQMDDGFVHDTDTMPGFAGSSWYFLRYMDPDNTKVFASKKAMEYWQEVDLYIGGTEHAVGHLMYSRFWHKFLNDKGLVPTNEPFKKLINQGMIQGRSLIMTVKGRDLHIQIQLADAQDRLYRNHYEEMIKTDNRFEDINIDDDIDWQKDEKGGQYVTLKAEVEKMSKSKYNVVNPDEVVEEYGADCFRMYEMFLGPIEQSKPWDTRSISGVSGFIRKLWTLFYDPISGKYLVNDEAATKEELKVIHTAIKGVSEDIERFSFNTCVSKFMVCVNSLKDLKCSKSVVLKELVALLAPFAPFIAEELWEILGNKGSVVHAIYPIHNDAFLVSDIVEYPICINGKKRSDATFPASASPKEIEDAVRQMEIVIKWTETTPIKKVIVVPGRMVNIVV